MTGGTISDAPIRTVARPVANLGNTCYMNAVLQALAHAPELCIALDYEPHQETCPVFLEQQSSSDEKQQDDETNATRKSRRSRSNDSDAPFCCLCEVENHIKRVHDPTKSTVPVAPSVFVEGFIEHVAPWFQLGVQEDSHEFLRLLIDAMQKSCKNARLLDPETNNNSKNNDQASTNDNNDKTTVPKPKTTTDQEYSFSLFRGTVESNVQCESCHANSSTLDPIEDVGLEVSINESLDVQGAFQRFAKTEHLDSGYKCEKCNVIGKATKQTKLASIPPILTLHLKRFRYGDRVAVPSSTRRSNRDVKTGSAKIEGHVKFDLFFDLQPYLTDELKKKHEHVFCRLFAVIVHNGKNSHSGHYIAYVQGINKNEWWKMDDSRVTQVNQQTVKDAEAYMLFYRVLQHPEAARLEALQKKQQEQQKADDVPVPRHNRKRKPTSKPAYKNTEDWARKTNLPSHILKVFQKVNDLISDDIQVSAKYCNQTKKSIVQLPLLDDDIVGGTSKYRRVLLEVFDKLRDHPRAANTWLATLSGPDSTQNNTVSLAEPDEPAGLL